MNDTIPWVDTHCHLEMIKQPVEVVMENNRKAGLDFCISIGTDHSSNKKVKHFCGQFNDVYGTLGFHPHGASNVQPDHVDWMKSELQSNKKLVAVGECGYDLYYEFSDRKAQSAVFETQLNLAVDLDLPVVIHSRDADDQTRDMLEAFKSKNMNGVVHCFTSDRNQAKYLLDAGFYLSFNGISTFPQAEAVRDVIQFMPRDRILLETDAPYLSPVPYRGKPNLPGRVSIVGDYLAKFLKMNAEDLAFVTTENTKTLFTRIDDEN